MAETIPTTEILNHDVLGIVDRINGFIIEMVKSVSANVAEITAPDLERTEKYIAALETYKKWVVDQPLLDLPETHPHPHPIPPNPDVPEMDNKSVGDLIRMLERMRDELIPSQSSRLPSTLVIFDSTRFDLQIAKINAFIESYVKVATPLDLPESSPSTPLTG